jgi:endonuclease/exonuclease/phosphatase family metal-dependent hydrolase
MTISIRIISVSAWNAENDRELRTKHLVKTILDMKIDILCMQDADESWERDISPELEGYSFQRDGRLIVASRYPIASHRELIVDGIPVQLVQVAGDYGGDECDIAIANIHLPVTAKTVHIENIMRKLNRIKHSDTVITGNFNRVSVETPTGWDLAGTEPTWPSWKTPQPPKQLDWSFVRLDKYTLDSAPVIRGLYVSNHLPVLIKLNEGQKN